MAYGSILGQRPNLSGYVTTEQLNQILANYVTNSNLSGQLDNYVTNTSLSSQLGNYVTNNTLNTQLDNYLELSGGTMTGQLNMGNQKIINVPDGVNNGDAVNFGQLSNVTNEKFFSDAGLSLNKQLTGNFTTPSNPGSSYNFQYLITNLSTSISYFDLKFFIITTGYYYGDSGYSYSPNIIGKLYASGNDISDTTITNGISLYFGGTHLSLGFRISSAIFANSKIYYNLKIYQ